MTELALLRDVLPGAISLLAVAISAFSVVNAGNYRRRDVHFDTVTQLYRRFFELQDLKLQYPYLSHLFTTAENYEAVKEHVGVVLQHVGDRELHEFPMRERAVVAMFLTFHEQLLFQWQKAGSRERIFAKDVIDYLEGRLFRNPRILWWWSADDVGLAPGYELVTRDRWTRYVLSGVDRTRPDWCDGLGPHRAAKQHMAGEGLTAAP